MGDLQEKAPPGWRGSVKAMKKHKDIDNPFALAWHMKKKGDTPHYKDKKKGKPEKKSRYKEWLANKQACEAQGKPGGVSAAGIPSCGDHDYQSYKKFSEWMTEREAQ